jgi:hypothetical protein
MAADFEKDLDRGKKGENLLIAHYYEPLIASTDYAYDFRTINSKLKVELKSDYWDMNNTENFFFERWSDVGRQTLGGPWRAVHSKVDRFVYLFVKNQTFYEFTNIRALCARIEMGITPKMIHHVKNKNWITEGFLIPRETVEDLCTVWRWNGDKRAKRIHR